jgi:hypothetical protein
MGCRKFNTGENKCEGEEPKLGLTLKEIRAQFKTWSAADHKARANELIAEYKQSGLHPLVSGPLASADPISP